MSWRINPTAITTAIRASTSSTGHACHPAARRHTSQLSRSTSAHRDPSRATRSSTSSHRRRQRCPSSPWCRSAISRSRRGIRSTARAERGRRNRRWPWCRRRRSMTTSGAMWRSSSCRHGGSARCHASPLQCLCRPTPQGIGRLARMPAGDGGRTVAEIPAHLLKRHPVVDRSVAVAWRIRCEPKHWSVPPTAW